MSKTAPITEANSSRAINVKIAGIRRNVTAFRNNVQETALMIVLHTMQYGDCTGAARLMEAMGDTARRRPLQDWFQMCSPIAVVPDKKRGQGKFRAHLRDKESKNFNEFDMEKGKATPWYEIAAAKPEPELMTSEDFFESYTKFMARWNKMLNPEEGSEPTRKVVDSDKGKIAKALKALAELHLEKKAA